MVEEMIDKGSSDCPTASVPALQCVHPGRHMIIRCVPWEAYDHQVCTLGGI